MGDLIIIILVLIASSPLWVRSIWRNRVNRKRKKKVKKSFKKKEHEAGYVCCRCDAIIKEISVLNKPDHILAYRCPICGNALCHNQPIPDPDIDEYDVDTKNDDENDDDTDDEKVVVAICRYCKYHLRGKCTYYMKNTNDDDTCLVFILDAKKKGN